MGAPSKRSLAGRHAGQAVGVVISATGERSVAGCRASASPSRPAACLVAACCVSDLGRLPSRLRLLQPLPEDFLSA